MVAVARVAAAPQSLLPPPRRRPGLLEAPRRARDAVAARPRALALRRDPRARDRRLLLPGAARRDVEAHRPRLLRPLRARAAHGPHSPPLAGRRGGPRREARLRHALRPRLLLRPQRARRREARGRGDARGHLRGLGPPGLTGRGSQGPSEGRHLGRGGLPCVLRSGAPDRLPGRAQEGLRRAVAPARERDRPVASSSPAASSSASPSPEPWTASTARAASDAARPSRRLRLRGRHRPPGPRPLRHTRARPPRRLVRRDPGPHRARRHVRAPPLSPGRLRPLPRRAPNRLLRPGLHALLPLRRHRLRLRPTRPSTSSPSAPAASPCPSPSPPPAASPPRRLSRRCATRAPSRPTSTTSPPSPRPGTSGSGTTASPGTRARTTPSPPRPRPRPRDRAAARGPRGRKRHHRRPRPPRPRLRQRIPRRGAALRRHAARHPRGRRARRSLLRDGREHRSASRTRATPAPTASFVYLDRFSLEYPRAARPRRRTSSRAGPPRPAAPASRPLRARSSSTPPARLPSCSAALSPGGRLAWNAEANHRYLAVCARGRPRARGPARSRDVARAARRTRPTGSLVAPEALLPAAEPLVAHREAQGLAALAVSLEDVVDEFGFGETGPHAVRDFLAFAFHRWQSPSPRYVLLLGDASYDPKGRLTGTCRPDLLPSPLTRSTFLWTPVRPPLRRHQRRRTSLPDLAIGRINAATLAEAQAAVQKILDFENAGLALDGKAVLVADNPDSAGDFEANQDDIASLLPSRPVEKIFLTQLGLARAAKAAVLAAPSTPAPPSSATSATARPASGPPRAPPLPRRRRPRPPAPAAPRPHHDLLQRLLRLPLHRTPSPSGSPSPSGKGAIAVFSPSGLSLNDAAHVYHRALARELERGGHDRLGDLVLAAQAAYAPTGAFPELLGHLPPVRGPRIEGALSAGSVLH